MSDESTFTFRVEGSEEQKTLLPSMVWAFDETYEIAGEHPAEALEKLVRYGIEWGILDAYSEFTITFVPTDDHDALATETSNRTSNQVPDVGLAVLPEETR